MHSRKPRPPAPNKAALKAVEAVAGASIILNGTKTQTRRLVKPQPVAGQGMVNAAYCGDRNLWLRDGPCDETDPAYQWRCPYGQHGDRIYVRETFVHGHDYDAVTDRLRTHDDAGNELLMKTWFRATEAPTWCDDDGWEANTPWKPAIHMPKALARIWLEITGVRVERLQDISAADAKAEGIEGQFADGPWRNYQRDGYWFPEGKDTAPILSFRSLWESTGGDWAANPWVWVIDFKRDLAQKGPP